LFFLIITISLCTCVEPYVPDLKDFESKMVVDALLTDENVSNYVRLTRTIEKLSDIPARISGASVTMKDDLGNTTTLAEKSAGEYRTDSLLFRGETGRTYTLFIKTLDGKEYESEPCYLYPAPDIDSLYYTKDQTVSEQTGETLEGIRIYIDSKEESVSKYYRWVYNEYWKFSVPDPKLFDYINDTTITPVSILKLTCWGHRQSDEIQIETTASGISTEFEKKPLLFISSEESNRLLIQYYIEVKQLSISKKEYEFWDLMTQLNEAGGDIFDKQPFQIFSNIKCKTIPGEMVLGYFQVSGVKKKSRYITVNEIMDLDLPLYRYECERFEKGEVDYPHETPSEGVTFNEINQMFVNAGFTFIKPVYDADNELYKLTFVRPLCAECTINGSLQAPYFWVDIE